MLLDIIRTTLALSLLLGQALAAPAPITRDVTPNGQHEKGDGIDISIGIYGTKTRVHFDGDGTPSVPLWGVYGPNARDIRQGKTNKQHLRNATLTHYRRHTRLLARRRHGRRGGPVSRISQDFSPATHEHNKAQVSPLRLSELGPLRLSDFCRLHLSELSQLHLSELS
jgi:hypothetical protein